MKKLRNPLATESSFNFTRPTGFDRFKVFHLFKPFNYTNVNKMIRRWKCLKFIFILVFTSYFLHIMLAEFIVSYGESEKSDVIARKIVEITDLRDSKRLQNQNTGQDVWKLEPRNLQRIVEMSEDKKSGQQLNQRTEQSNNKDRNREDLIENEREILKSKEKALGVDAKDKEMKALQGTKKSASTTKGLVVKNNVNQYENNAGVKEIITKTQQGNSKVEIDHIIDRGTDKLKTLQGLKIRFPDNRSKSVYGDFGCNEKTFFKNQVKELLTKWIGIAKEYNISYALFAGSLLGAVRNADMVPYDYDMDILVDVKYYPVLEAISEKRNFKPDGHTAHFVMQPGFNHSRPLNDLRFFTCDGRDVRSIFLYL